MTRGKIRRVKIANDTRRKHVLRNRMDGLLKKANELSVLSDSDVAIVIHTPEQNNATLYPSLDDFRARLNRFFDFPDMERDRKMVLHEKFLEKVVEEETENLRKSQRSNNQREYENLFNQLIEGKNVAEFDSTQVNMLYTIATEKLKELDKREEELDTKPPAES